MTDVRAEDKRAIKRTFSMNMKCCQTVEVWKNASLVSPDFVPQVTIFLSMDFNRVAKADVIL